MNKERAHLVVNALLFQGCWFSAILLGWQWAMIPLVAMLLHAAMVFLTAELFYRISLLALVGIAVDSLWLNLSVYEFDAHFSLLIPLWLSTLWFGFALTVPSSLSFMLDKPALFITACTILGPVSYAAGRRLGALNFDDAALFAIAVEWALIACLVLFLFGSSKLTVSAHPAGQVLGEKY